MLTLATARKEDANNSLRPAFRLKTATRLTRDHGGVSLGVHDGRQTEICISSAVDQLQIWWFPSAASIFGAIKHLQQWAERSLSAVIVTYTNSTKVKASKYLISNIYLKSKMIYSQKMHFSINASAIILYSIDSITEEFKHSESRHVQNSSRSHFVSPGKRRNVCFGFCGELSF